MKLLVTGAAGHMATLALPGLADHELRLADLHRPAHMPPGAVFHPLGLLNATDADMRRLFEGIDAVVHSAYIASAERDVYSVSPPQIDRFNAEFENIRMAQRVYRCALDAGVRRVVVVSSNHAADWYEHSQNNWGQIPISSARERASGPARGAGTKLESDPNYFVHPTDLPLSDNFYGWSKASYELLAYPYACGTFGRRMEIVMLRIGSPYPIDVARYEPGVPPAASSLVRPMGPAAFKRALGAWLSDRDCAALFRCAVQSPLALPTGAVPWVIAYGISNNTRAFWSLESARGVLDYSPQDDSEVAYADAVRRLLTCSGSASAGRLGSH